MKKYTVLFSLKPAVRLDPKLRTIDFNFEKPKKLKRIVISKIEKTISGYRIQSGLQLRVFLQAENLKTAINEAKSFADAIVSFITLITGVGLKIPVEELAYEITLGVKERDLIQVFHDPFRISISRRTLDEQLLTQLIDRAMKSTFGKMQRIGRAMRWYRMGTLASDVFDRFNCFWIGLEALNPILQDKFLVGDDPTKCPACGHEWPSIPTVSGIRTFVQGKIPDGKKLYRRFRDLRINIAHSKRELTKLHKEASNLAPKIAEVLFRAICFLLGVEGWDKIPHKGILEQVPTRIELEATLVGGDPKSLGPEGQDPFFEPEHEVFTPKPSATGVTFEGTLAFTARLNPKVKWKPREVRFFGDSEMSGSITKTEVHRKSDESTE